MGQQKLEDARAHYHEELLCRTKEAIDRLASSGCTVSFYSVAKHAGIARSTLYRCEDLRALIANARATQRLQSTTVSKSSLAQIEALEDEVSRLHFECDALRQERDDLLRQNKLSKSSRHRAVQYATLTLNAA